MVPRAPESMFTAAGYHNQRIYVAPEQDLVIVRNSYYKRLTELPKASISVGIQTMGADEWDEAKVVLPILNSLKPAS